MAHIAAPFPGQNRYVHRLAAFVPTSPEIYRQAGKRPANVAGVGSAGKVSGA